MIDQINDVLRVVATEQLFKQSVRPPFQTTYWALRRAAIVHSGDSVWYLNGVRRAAYVLAFSGNIGEVLVTVGIVLWQDLTGIVGLTGYERLYSKISTKVLTYVSHSSTYVTNKEIVLWRRRRCDTQSRARRGFHLVPFSRHTTTHYPASKSPPPTDAASVGRCRCCCIARRWLLELKKIANREEDT